MKSDETVQSNPLQKFFRQPKIYIRLPSSGNFYPAGALEKTETGEYPVYAMTAKDEITMKTPDALLNGQATVEVIQSCIPNIKNAWAIPSIDIDALLVAMRIATYGETLDVEVTVPNTEITKTYTTDLRLILDRLIAATFDTAVEFDNMTIYIRPLTYREFTLNAIKTLEEQRIFDIVNDDSLSEDEKVRRFNESFSKLTEITIDMVKSCIDRIEIEGATITDPRFIREFVDKAEKVFYNRIVQHLEKQRDSFKIQPFKIKTTKEEQKDGAPLEFEVPLSLDVSNFFE